MQKNGWVTQIGADGLTFGERLKDLIERSGKTAKQVSVETGISQSALSDFQKDYRFRMPDSDTFRTIAKYFDVTYEYLYGDVRASRTENLVDSKRFGFSDTAIEKLLSLDTVMQNKNFKVVEHGKAAKREILNHILSSGQFKKVLMLIEQSIICNINMEARFVNDKVTAGDLINEIGVVEGMQNVVLRNEEAKEYYILQAVDVFRDIVRSITTDCTPEEAYRTEVIDLQKKEIRPR